MSNPTNLHELADSLAASANMTTKWPGWSPTYAAGYREALLDTRATVLAMITDASNIASLERDITTPAERLADAVEATLYFDLPAAELRLELEAAWVSYCQSVDNEPDGPCVESTPEVGS